MEMVQRTFRIYVTTEADRIMKKLFRRHCGGQVTTLTGHVVLFTGRVFVDGGWTTREESTRLLKQRGIMVAGNPSRRVSLVVAGDLSYQILTDQTNQRSAKILFVVEQRRSGNHLCVVTATGYSSLLRGNPAYCLDLEGADPPVELSGPFMS